MTSRPNLLLAVAGIIALATAFVVRNHVGTNDAAASLPENVTRVLVASSDLSPGSFIRGESHLEWVEWPSNNISDSYLLEGKTDIDEYSGSVVRRQVMKGEPVTDSILVQADEGGFMAAVLSPGKRAVSIAVDSTTGNAGFIFPGDKVDLILTHSIPVINASGENDDDVLASETFIENVRVLAVDQQLDNPENQAILAKTVTLEVARDQAEKINVAKDLGKISLSLRSLMSDDTQEASADNVHRIRNATRDSDVSSVLMAPSNASMRKVTVIRGTERLELQFGK